MRRLKLTLTVMLFLLSGCSSSEEPKTDEPPSIGEPALVSSSEQLSLPMSAYVLDDLEVESILQAYALLTSSCMTRFFPAFDSPVKPQNGENDPFNLGRRYGIIDQELAATRGYAVPPAASDGDDKNPKNGMSVHEDAVYRGSPEAAGVVDVNGGPVPAGGCGKEANDTLGAGQGSIEIPVTTAANESYARSEADPRVEAAQSDWVACMRDKGYDFESPWGPWEIDWPRPPRREEIETATADVECRKATNLVGIWNAVESAFQKAEIEQHPETWSDLLEQKNELLAQADKVLLEGGNG